MTANPRVCARLLSPERSYIDIVAISGQIARPNFTYIAPMDTTQGPKLVRPRPRWQLLALIFNLS